MGDWIVISVLLLIVAAIVFAMVKNKKTGRTACGCDCSKCGKGCRSSMK